MRIGRRCRSPLAPTCRTVPVRDIVLFPYVIAPLFVGREKSRRAIECAMAADRRIVVVTQRRAGDDDPAQEGLDGVGVIASVIDFMPLPDGSLRIITRSLERVTLTHCIMGDMLAAKVAPFAELRGDLAQAVTLARTVLECLRAYLKTDFSAEPYNRLPQIREPGVLAVYRAADAGRDRPTPRTPRDRRCDQSAREDFGADEERPAGGVGRGLSAKWSWPGCVPATPYRYGTGRAPLSGSAGTSPAMTIQ